MKFSVWEIIPTNQKNPCSPWHAIFSEEPPGKPLDKCMFKRIVITVHKLAEDREVKIEHGNSAKRCQQILRVAREAESQNTLLTIEYLATLLVCDEKTIWTDIKRLKEDFGIDVPIRGNICDIGPGVTHKHKAGELFIQVTDEVEITRNMKHSLKAVYRYINDFCKIRIYSRKGVDPYFNSNGTDAAIGTIKIPTNKENVLSQSAEP